MQVAHKNKARLEHDDEDEEFDMESVVVPDLGLDKHAKSEEYLSEVSQADMMLVSMKTKTRIDSWDMDHGSCERRRSSRS
jgi:hypothetical protein